MADEADMPLENFGADTEVAAPPAAEPAEPQGDEGEQTAQESEGSGSEETTEAQPESTEDNPKPEENESTGRPEKRDRLQNRFGELTGKIKERDAYIEQMEAQLARNQALAGVNPLTPDEDGQVDIQQLQQHQQEQAQAIASAEVSNLRNQLERESIANRFDTEGTQIEQTLSEKGFDDPVHIANIEAEISERVALAQYNLNALKQISPKQIAERYIKGVEAERRRAQSSTAQNLQDVKAQAGVVPDSAPSGVDPNSPEALEARVADIKF